MRLFVLAGEASGDVLGAGLVAALRSLLPSGEALQLAGLGGPALAREGLVSFFDYRALSIIGLTGIVRSYPRLRFICRDLVRRVFEWDPELVLTIDVPDFSIHFTELLRRRGWRRPIIHYVSPTVWVWRPGRARRFARVYDGLVCLYRFEQAFYRQTSLTTCFVGHPASVRRPRSVSPPVFPGHKKLALVFGSRASELQTLGPLLIETANMLADRLGRPGERSGGRPGERPGGPGGLAILVPPAPFMREELETLCRQLRMPVWLAPESAALSDVVAAADAALVVAGTAALETALRGVPHLVTYRVSLLTWWVIRLLRLKQRVHLVNIASDMDCIPEFLQHRARPELMAPALAQFLTTEEGSRQRRRAAPFLEHFQPPLAVAAPDDPGDSGDRQENPKTPPLRTPSRLAAEFLLKFAEPRPATPSEIYPALQDNPEEL